jgi:TP901-1 family phage major tail protein
MGLESAGIKFLLQQSNEAETEVFTTLGGLRSKSLSLNGEAIDITNHGSQEWRELLEGVGLNSMDVSGSGIFVDHATMAQVKADFFARKHRRYRLINDETGETFTAKFKLSSLELSGEHNGEKTYSLSLQSDGVVEYFTGVEEEPVDPEIEE